MVRKRAKKKKKRRGRLGAPPVRLLMTATAFALVAAVLFVILPREGGQGLDESLSDLKNRLAEERGERENELRTELDEWQMKNEKLEREIERLSERAP